MADNDKIEHGNKRQKVESSEQQQRAAYSEDMQRIRSTLNEKDDGEPSADNKSKDKEVGDKDSKSKHQLSESREQQRMLGSDEEEDNDKWLKNYKRDARTRVGAEYQIQVLPLPSPHNDAGVDYASATTTSRGRISPVAS